MAGAAVLDTSLPVSVLGYSTSVGPRDGAFIVVAPSLTSGMDMEGALNALLQEAGGRLVMLINPRLGNAPILTTFEPCYLFRRCPWRTYLTSTASKSIRWPHACFAAFLTSIPSCTMPQGADRGKVGLDMQAASRHHHSRSN